MRFKGINTVKIGNRFVGNKPKDIPQIATMMPKVVDTFVVRPYGSSNEN